MHIALFHERFIFRFGVDRVLLCLAKQFVKQGHTVTLVGQKFDNEWSLGKSVNLIKLPDFCPYIESDLRATRWLQENWKVIFREGSEPDVALVGGWPFFQTMGLLKSKGVKVWFQDYGIAPEEGFGEEHAHTINLLRVLKEHFCRFADGIAPISNFIKKSQSNQVSSNNQPVEVVLLGVDHAKILRNKKLERADSKRKVKIFSIGRFELGVYKQSEQVFELAQALKKRALLFEIKILAPLNTKIPAGLSEVILPTGFLSDQEMFQLMADSTLCVCFSRWEGFNLNLAESQATQTPCLVYNCAAHPEVVADTWFLCESLNEMANKAESFVMGTAPQYIQSKAFLKNYAKKRSWNGVAKQFIKIFEEDFSKHDYREHEFFNREKAIFVEVGNACSDPANSGVVRVCRQLSARLADWLSVVFVCWDDKLCDLRFPTESELKQLSTFGGPASNHWQPMSESFEKPLIIWDFFCPSEPLLGWLIIPEIKPPQAIKFMVAQSRRWGLKIAAIFYDAIAVLSPDLIKDPQYRDSHLYYMKSLSECDVVIPISEHSAADLQIIWEKNQIKGTVKTILLPGSFKPERPRKTSLDNANHIILCVSTVEPRKNHLRLLDAFCSYKDRNPRSKSRLVLVGNRCAGAEDLAAKVQAVVSKRKDIEWRGVVSDEELHKLYSESIFTVYPSEIEGFGLPIVESLWHGIPCICHQEGVMAEIAKGGGCLTADVCNIESLASAIGKLDTDKNLRLNLFNQARDREIKTWEQYAQEFLATLCLVNAEARSAQISKNKKTEDWKSIVFGDAIHEGWQMNESEKIGMLGILASLKPDLALEIGTYKGGSLSLIRQHAKSVISIDIDPAIAKTFKWMENVKFLTGKSKDILPLLIAELDAKAFTPQFVLVDGDHSTDGVKADLENILIMRPRKACFILIHDMGNRLCRLGAEKVNWSKYKNVHYVDLDFIPGRITENGSKFDGELWGGLGMICLLPEERENDLQVLRGSQKMLDILGSKQV